MNGNITLSRFTSQPITEPGVGQHLWCMQIIAQGSGDFPSDIFIFRTSGQTGLDPVTQDTFFAVASAHDLQELPLVIDSTSEVSQCPFYRRSTVTLYLRTPEEVERVWKAIQRDTHALVRNIIASTKLKLVDQSAYTADGAATSVDTTTLPVPGQTLFQIDYRPAGLADINGDGYQVVITPDTALTGWLPIEEFSGSAPTCARLFYNLGADTNLGAVFPIKEPTSQHLVFFNGLKLSLNGGPVILTKNGIFWRDFPPADESGNLAIVDGDLLVAQPGFGNAPWPLDYVSRESPGSIIPTFEILIFE